MRLDQFQNVYFLTFLCALRPPLNIKSIYSTNGSHDMQYKVIITVGQPNPHKIEMVDQGNVGPFN